MVTYRNIANSNVIEKPTAAWVTTHKVEIWSTLHSLQAATFEKVSFLHASVGLNLFQ